MTTNKAMPTKVYDQLLICDVYDGTDIGTLMLNSCSSAFILDLLSVHGVCGEINDLTTVSAAFWSSLSSLGPLVYPNIFRWDTIPK